MLASDSDSDFEYPADGNNSEASDDCVLLGKLALGVDPSDLKVYDGKSTPVNGSQYLMKVIAEKKSVPKVVSADPYVLSAAVGRKKERSFEEDGGPNGTVHYLDKFLQGSCTIDEDTNGGSFLPSGKWREETTSCFSLIRTKVEKWQYKVEAKEVKFSDPVIMPKNSDNTQWLKFCFGDGFIKLSGLLKTRTKEEKLSDFFLDLYDPAVVEVLASRYREERNSCKVAKQDNQSSNVKVEVSQEDAESVNADDDAETSEDVTTSLQLGNRPLMNLVLQLNQNQLENLVKWNLLWVKSFGFVNECQGKWLYAILACLFKPLDPGVMSDLRSIVRILIKTRTQFAQDWGLCSSSTVQSGDGDATTTTARLDEKVFDYINTLNLFIYLIADYFQQKDLVMHL